MYDSAFLRGFFLMFNTDFTMSTLIITVSSISLELVKPKQINVTKEMGF